MDWVWSKERERIKNGRSPRSALLEKEYLGDDIMNSGVLATLFQMTLRKVSGNVKEAFSCVSLEFRVEFRVANKRVNISIQMGFEGMAFRGDYLEHMLKKFLCYIPEQFQV